MGLLGVWPGTPAPSSWDEEEKKYEEKKKKRKNDKLLQVLPPNWRSCSRLPFSVTTARNHWPGSATHRSPNADLSSRRRLSPSLSVCVSRPKTNMRKPRFHFPFSLPSNIRGTGATPVLPLFPCLPLVRSEGSWEEPSGAAPGRRMNACNSFFFLFPPSLRNAGQKKKRPCGMQSRAANMHPPKMPVLSISLYHIRRISPGFSLCSFFFGGGGRTGAGRALVRSPLVGLCSEQMGAKGSVGWGSVARLSFWAIPVLAVLEVCGVCTWRAQDYAFVRPYSGRYPIFGNPARRRRSIVGSWKGAEELPSQTLDCNSMRPQI